MPEAKLFMSKFMSLSIIFWETIPSKNEDFFEHWWLDEDWGAIKIAWHNILSAIWIKSQSPDQRLQ